MIDLKALPAKDYRRNNRRNITNHLWLGGVAGVSIFYELYDSFQYPSPEGFKPTKIPFYKVGWVSGSKKKYRVFTTLKSLKTHLIKLGVSAPQVLDKLS